MELLKLEEFIGGALQEKVNMAMREVIDNMRDANTPWKKKRHIIIKISFAQNEDRDDAEVETSVNVQTAPISPMSTRMMIGKDLKTGEVYAQEYGKQVKGQMSLDMAKLARIDGDTVDTETGEVVAENNKVVDLRKAAL